MEWAIELENVERHYPMGNEVVHALRGINLRMERGSFWAVMGPSGSGKSTLLNILGCLDRPGRGRFLLAGHETGRLPDDALSAMRLKHLGFIFQSFHLIPQLTVAENIALPLHYLGWEAKKSFKRAAELAERVGLGDRLRHRPSELSGGQQQRAAIARALANDPQVLLADEPTGNLDSATGEQIMGLIEELHRQGKTIIMVTHEPNLAARASLRLHLRDGLVESIEGEKA